MLGSRGLGPARAAARGGAEDDARPLAGKGMATDAKNPDKSPYGRFAVGIVTVRVAFGILAVVRLTSYKSTLEVLEHWTGEDKRPRAELRLLSPAAVTFSALTATDLAILLVGYRQVGRHVRQRDEAEELLKREKEVARSTGDALPTHIAILDQ